MKLRPVAGVVLRQFYLMRGSPTRVLPVFAWVALDIIVWGFITHYLNGVSRPGLNFTRSLLGAVLFWDFFQRVMQGVTLAFFEDVWSRNFLNVFATPLRIPEYICGLVLSSISTSIFALAIMLLLATLVFGLPFFALGLLLVPFMLVLFMFGIALGVLACAMVLRFGPASEWLVWPIPALLSPFVAVFYPISTLPHWMQYISYVLPPMYVFENLRAVVAGGTPSWYQLGIALVLALAQIGLAAQLFARVHRYAVRTGLLARYSAESTT